MAIGGSFINCTIAKGNMRSKGKYVEYRKLNASFHKKARQDKEKSIIDKFKYIEENSKMGKTRDLFK